MDLHRENTAAFVRKETILEGGAEAALRGRRLSLISPVAGRYRDTLTW